MLPLAGEELVQLLLQFCGYVSVQGEGEGKKSTKTETAGEGSQLSNNGITEAANSLDLQGTLNYLDSNHSVLQNTERHWGEGSSRRGLGLDGWKFLHAIRIFISNYLVRESTKSRGRQRKGIWEGIWGPRDPRFREGTDQAKAAI